MSKKSELNEKHWQALRLFEEGKLTRNEIAKTMGWSRDHIDHLCSGSVAACGVSATLFKAELGKIEKKRDDTIKSLVKSNTEKAQKLISVVFSDIESKKKITAEDRKILSMYTNALSKFQPTVNIKNLSYSYTKGLTAEELIHEFKRLKTDSEASFNRGRVQEAAEGGTRELPEVAE